MSICRVVVEQFVRRFHDGPGPKFYDSVREVTSAKNIEYRMVDEGSENVR